MVKYFPVSRRNPSRSSLASQSALLTIRAGFVVLSKSSSRASCGLIPARLRSISSSESNGRSCVGFGSPIMPVPPPTTAIGE